MHEDVGQGLSISYYLGLIVTTYKPWQLHLYRRQGSTYRTLKKRGFRHINSTLLSSLPCRRCSIQWDIWYSGFTLLNFRGQHLYHHFMLILNPSLPKDLFIWMLLYLSNLKILWVHGFFVLKVLHITVVLKKSIGWSLVVTWFKNFVDQTLTITYFVFQLLLA